MQRAWNWSRNLITSVINCIFIPTKHYSLKKKRKVRRESIYTHQKAEMPFLITINCLRNMPGKYQTTSWASNVFSISYGVEATAIFGAFVVGEWSSNSAWRKSLSCSSSKRLSRHKKTKRRPLSFRFLSRKLSKSSFVIAKNYQ